MIMKKALLVGINYPGTQHALHGFGLSNDCIIEKIQL